MLSELMYKGIRELAAAPSVDDAIRGAMVLADGYRAATQKTIAQLRAGEPVNVNNQTLQIDLILGEAAMLAIVHYLHEVKELAKPAEIQLVKSAVVDGVPLVVMMLTARGEVHEVKLSPLAAENLAWKLDQAQQAARGMV